MDSSKYFITGGYKGNKEKYGKRVTPYFNTYQEALHHKQTYSVFSLSLSEGTIEKEENKDESIR